ncbi:MAG: DUF4402 domain-containing protein [Porphyrobacter sp.]|nr:DUF4402 domain-containing protein [Porphyrobacter sp.]
MAGLRRAVSVLLAGLALALPLPAFAQSDTATAEAQATLFRPGTVIKLADMDFGDIAKPLAAGTVVIPANGSSNCTTTGGLVHSGACESAYFRGDLGFLNTVIITKPVGGQIFLTGPNGATMRVNNFTFGSESGMWLTSSSSTQQRYLVVDFSGIFTFRMGGTLNVAANQRAGVYQGTYALDINYN